MKHIYEASREKIMYYKLINSTLKNCYASIKRQNFLSVSCAELNGKI